MTRSMKNSEATNDQPRKAARRAPASKAEWILRNFDPTPNFPMDPEMEAQIPADLPGPIPRSEREFLKAL